jgi:hypothetical protein
VKRSRSTAIKWNPSSSARETDRSPDASRTERANENPAQLEDDDDEDVQNDDAEDRRDVGRSS